MSHAATFSACPACSAAPATTEIAARALAAEGDRTITLSLPTIHCAACIAAVETGLAAQPGIRSARVNLTRKRVTVVADPEIDARDIAARVAALGYEAHELDPGALSATDTDRGGRDLLMRMAVAGFAMMNVMLLSVSVWSGAEGPTRDLFHWVSAAITLPAVIFSGQPFYVSAWAALRAGRLNMDVPITLAILLAIATSIWETALSGEHAYFDAAIALTFFLLAGRYLDHRTRVLARSAAQELTALEVPRAMVLRDGTPEEIPAARLAIGDRVLVRPGARMPGDGVIEDGRSELDRSLLTGETLPVAVGPDAVVSAGEVNLTGPLTVRLTAVGRDSSLARMAELVAVAESGRDNYTPLADRAAKLYAPGVHILSALSFLGWLVWSGDVRISLNIAAAVLIITCPCALGLAVPAVTTAASGRLFRRGLLIKNGTALERLADVDTVVFDKTGTLTAGEPVATNLDAFAKEDLAVLRGLAEGSAHPLAQAAVRGVADLGVAAAVIAAREERPGDGIHGTWNGRAVRLGRSDADAGATATWFSIGDGPARPILFSDRLRPGAERAVRELAAMGLSVRLLSGDAEGPVERLAADLGIDQWTARCRPEEKARIVQNLAQNGHRVLMVGDGLNDTAALAAAHVSVSPASALDAARVASDIVLLGTDLGPLPDAVRVARKATTRIAENFRIATLYNIIAVPLAVAGMATPLIAALAMSISSITVSLNALRLGRRT